MLCAQRNGISAQRLSGAQWSRQWKATTDRTMDQSRQMLILMKGHPGCAKSTVSRALAQALRCPVVDKDDIRDATLSLEASDRPAPPAPTVLNTLSYDVMWRVVETQLQIALDVVVDCPLARPSLFQAGSRLAQRYGCMLLIVECVAGDVNEWKRRLEARARNTPGSIEGKTTCMPSLGSSTRNSKCAKQSADTEPRVESGEFGRELSEVHSQHAVSVIDLENGSADDLLEAIRLEDEKAGRHRHKPSLWEDVEKLVEGYAKCYEYETGSTKKLMVDTTSLSTEAAVSSILAWIRNIDENSTELVSSLP